MVKWFPELTRPTAGALILKTLSCDSGVLIIFRAGAVDCCVHSHSIIIISSWQKKGGPAILMAPLLTNQIKESIYQVYDRCSWIEDWNDYCSLKLMLYNSFYISSKCVWRKSIPKGLGRDKRWYLENCYQKKVCRPILVILAGNSSLEHS